jgi:hypothetical protein
MKALSFLAATVAASTLLGCSTGFTDPAAPASLPGVALSGGVHGGQQPVSGAKIYLYAAGTGGPGAASRSMLNGTGYVTTASDGTFSITGDYTCQAGDMVYLLARGGNPGLASGTNNTKLVLETALGACSALSPSTFVQINEVTTVAAVYALNGFQSGAGYLASGSSTAALRGLANAFGMANVLVSNTTGRVQPLPVGSVGTLIPQAEINTLANVIAPCVNSDGTGSPCASLFAAMTGGSPTDTLGALVTLANAPGVNVAGVYALSTSNAPFQPALTAAPNDWSIAVDFGSGQVHPQAVAIDAYGNAWFPRESFNGSIQELGPNGALLSPAGVGYQPVVFTNPIAIAIDDPGNIWIANYGDGFTAGSANVAKMSPAGVLLSPTTGYTASTLASPQTMAIDGTGSIWVTAPFHSLTKFDTNGNLLSNANGFYNTGGYQGVAVDASNNLWGVYNGTATEISSAGVHTGDYAVNASAYSVAINGTFTWVAGNSSLTVLNASGAQTTPAGGITGGGINDPVGIAVDGYGSSYTINAASYNGNTNAAHNVSETYSNGTVVSPATGYMSSYLYSPNGIAVDLSGNVWVSDATAGAVVFVGLANPVVTPIATAVKNNKLGALP